MADRDDSEAFLAAAHTSWASDCAAAQAEVARQAQHAAAREAEQAAQQRMHDAGLHHGTSYGPPHWPLVAPASVVRGSPAAAAGSVTAGRRRHGRDPLRGRRGRGWLLLVIGQAPYDGEERSGTVTERPGQVFVSGGDGGAARWSAACGRAGTPRSTEYLLSCFLRGLDRYSRVVPT